MAAFEAEGLKALQSRILAHWGDVLRPAGERAGPDGRAAILNDIVALAHDDPSLTGADLTMLADLMLIDRAPAVRS